MADLNLYGFLSRLPEVLAITNALTADDDLVDGQLIVSKANRVVQSSGFGINPDGRITIGGVTIHAYSYVLLNNNFVDLPVNTVGSGSLIAGNNEESADFNWNLDGTPLIKISSENVSNTETLGHLCLFSNTANSLRVLNKLGSHKNILFTLFYR